MRVLVLGAGGPAGVNVCRALTEAGHEPVAVDHNRTHLLWAEPYAELMPFSDMEKTPRGKLGCDVALAQPDPLVEWLSHHRTAFPATFLPRHQTITLCQDKFECGLAWRRAGCRDDRIVLVEDKGMLLDAEAYFPDGFWLRARSGAGARGAIHARRWREASAWYDFWQARSPDLEFVAEAFLPGRDYSWCGIYRNGERQASFARERLEYIYPRLSPEGLTGTPTIARVVRDVEVDQAAQDAVYAVAPEAHGVFCVDLREDDQGRPRPTEINAGRFSTTVGLWSTYSEWTNFVALAAELAVGDDHRLDNWWPLPEGLTLMRHIDCGHHFVSQPLLVGLLGEAT